MDWNKHSLVYMQILRWKNISANKGCNAVMLFFINLFVCLPHIWIVADRENINLWRLATTPLGSKSNQFGVERLEIFIRGWLLLTAILNEVACYWQSILHCLWYTSGLLHIVPQEYGYSWHNESTVRRDYSPRHCE